MLYSEDNRNVLLAIAVSFSFFLVSPFFAHSQTDETDAVFILKGNTILKSGEGIENVEIELKKDGQIVKKIMSGKNGRYSLEFEISILNKNNEYRMFISQVGTASKTLTVNTYISPEEYSRYSVPRYEFKLPITMTQATTKDIVLEQAAGKIQWDYEHHEFTFAQTEAKIIHRDDDDPDKFLADKKKKEEEELELAKKKAEEARIKADADAKAEAERIVHQNLEAQKQELRRQHKKDSLDSVATAASQVVETKKLEMPISPDDVDPNAFDGTDAYSINVAKKTLKAVREKMNKEKAANLSAKYETNNTLTSLLNMVDEDEKNQKLKIKDMKQ